MPVFDPAIFDGALFDAGGDHGFTLDAVLLDTQVGSFTFDAVLKREATGAFTLDAAVIGGAVGSATLDAVLFREATGSATLDAVLTAGAGTNSFTLDAVIRSDEPQPSRRAPRFRASGTSGANAGTFTQTLPSLFKGGDFHLLVVHTSNQAYATPSGWTPVPDSPQTIGTAGAAGAIGLYAFYRFAKGNDTSLAITDSGDHQLTNIYSFRGVDPQDPFDTSSGGTTSSSTALSATGLTTTVDNTRVVVIAASAIDSGQPGLDGLLANSDLTGFINHTPAQTNVGTGGSFAVASGIRETTGAVGNTTGTFREATNQAFLTLALNPSRNPWLTAVGGRFEAATGVNATTEWPTTTVSQSGAYEAGDFGLLVVESAGGDIVSAPSGWTALTTPNQSGAAQATDTRLSLFYRRSLSYFEPPVTVVNVGNHLYTKILTFANVYEFGNPVNASSSNVNSTATTSKSVTGLTTTVDNTLVLSFVAWANDSSGPLATNASWANASLDFDGEIDDQGAQSGNGGGVAIAAGRDFVAGAVGATTATFTSSISAHQMVALTPQRSFSLDAVLARVVEGSFTLDAFVSEPFGTVTAAAVLDAALLRVSSATATLNAILLRASAASFTLDAIRRVGVSNSFSFDAEKVFTIVASATLDATFFKTTSTLFYLRAFIENGDAAEWEDREDEEQNGGPGGPGAGDGPKALPIIRIWANGVDIAPDVMFQDAQFTTLVNGGIGQFSFRVRDTAKVKDFTTGMEVAVDINGIRRFGGYATLVTRLYTFPAVDTSDLDRTDRFWRISGVDYNILFAKRILYDHANPANVGLRTWPAGSASDTVIRYVISNYTDLLDDGVTLDLVENVGSPNPDKIGVIGSGGLTAADAMREINRLISGVWYIDPYKQLVYTDVDTPNASKGLSDHPTVGTQVGYRDFSHVENGASLVNDALVWGAGQGSARVAFARSTDATSISQHGRWQFGEFTTALYKQVSVNERASTIVYGTDQSKRGGKDDQVSWTAITFDHNFTVGQKVAIESDTFGASDVVPIRRYTLTFPTTTAPQYQLVLSHEVDEPWNFFEFYFPPFPAFDFDFDINIPPINLPPGPGGCADCGITDTFDRTYTEISQTTAGSGRRWTTQYDTHDGLSSNVPAPFTSAIPLPRAGVFYGNAPNDHYTWQTTFNEIDCPAGTDRVRVECQMSTSDWIVATNPQGFGSSITVEVRRHDWGNDGLQIGETAGNAGEVVATKTFTNLNGSTPTFPGQTEPFAFEFDLYPGQTRAQFFMRPTLFPAPSTLTTTDFTAPIVVKFLKDGTEIGSGSWGTSDSGLDWTVSGTPASFSISGTEAIHRLIPGTTTNFAASELAASGSDLTVTAQVTLDNGSPHDFRGPSINGTGATDSFSLSFGTTGSLQLLADAGSDTAATSVDPYLPFKLRVASDGATLQGKVWQATDPEPSAWDVSIATTDLVFDTFNLATGATAPFTAAITVEWDDLDISGVDACSEYKSFDNFERTVTSGWGSSSSGYPYTVTNNNANATLTVAGGFGKLTHGSAGGGFEEWRAFCPPVASGSFTFRMRVKIPQGTGISGVAGVLSAYFSPDADPFALSSSTWGIDLETSEIDPDVPGMTASIVSNDGFIGAIELVGPIDGYVDVVWEHTQGVGNKLKVWEVGTAEPGWGLDTTTGASNDPGAWSSTTKIIFQGFLNDITTGNIIFVDWIDFDYEGRPCFGDVLPNEFETPIEGPGRADDEGTGSQTVFQLPVAFIPGSTRVYVNGIFQRPGIAREYTEQASAGTITFADPPPNGASIQIFYEANGSL
jgi:hypothetical protein